MKESLEMISTMALVHTAGLMVEFTRGIGKMTGSMVMVLYVQLRAR